MVHTYFVCRWTLPQARNLDTQCCLLSVFKYLGNLEEMNFLFMNTVAALLSVAVATLLANATILYQLVKAASF